MENGEVLWIPIDPRDYDLEGLDKLLSIEFPGRTEHYYGAIVGMTEQSVFVRKAYEEIARDHVRDREEANNTKAVRARLRFSELIKSGYARERLKNIITEEELELTKN